MAKHRVLRLKRIQCGSVRLGQLAVGDVRELSLDEVTSLRDSTLRKDDIEIGT